MPALVSLAAAVLSGIFALVRHYGAEDETPMPDGRHFGRGPYASCDCSPNENFIEKLVEIIDQLRDAAVGENWKIDWDKLNQFHARADQSAHRPTTSLPHAITSALSAS